MRRRFSEEFTREAMRPPRSAASAIALVRRSRQGLGSTGCTTSSIPSWQTGVSAI